MRCPRCQAYCGRHDNYCRNCGLALRPLRLPVKRNGGLPALWQRSAPVVAQGVTALALGALTEMALRALARRTVGGLSSWLVPRAKGKRLPTKHDGPLPAPEATYAVSETVVMRRVTLRQGSGQALRR